MTPNDQQRKQWALEDHDHEIYLLWQKEREGDKFRDSEEEFISLDYFRAGYEAAHLRAPAALPELPPYPPLPKPYYPQWSHSNELEAFVAEQVHNYARAYALAALAGRGQDAWQPIETAPRTLPHDAAEVVILGFAPDEEGFSPTSCEGFWSPLDGEWRRYGDPTWKHPPQPTHWMPLPKAPAAIAASAGKEKA